MYYVKSSYLFENVLSVVDDMNELLNRQLVIIVNTIGNWRETVKIIVIKVKDKNYETVMDVRDFRDKVKHIKFKEMTLIGETDTFRGEVLKLERNWPPPRPKGRDFQKKKGKLTNRDFCGFVINHFYIY